jgi:hypothetical protein
MDLKLDSCYASCGPLEYKLAAPGSDTHHDNRPCWLWYPCIIHQEHWPCDYWSVKSSLSFGARLIIIGIVIAKLLTLAVSGEWDTITNTPSFSQLVRDRLSSSIVTIPAEFEEEGPSVIFDHHSTILTPV